MARAKFVSPMKFGTIAASRVMNKAEQEKRKEARVPKPFSGAESFALTEAMSTLHDSINEVIFKPVTQVYEQQINAAVAFMNIKR